MVDLRHILRCSRSKIDRMTREGKLQKVYIGGNVRIGLGKTQAYLERLPQLTPTLKPGHCVLVAVPEHKLSQELKRRALGAGIDAEVYLGPAQDDPGQPGETMCRIEYFIRLGPLL